MSLLSYANSNIDLVYLGIQGNLRGRSIVCSGMPGPVCVCSKRWLPLRVGRFVKSGGRIFKTRVLASSANFTKLSYSYLEVGVFGFHVLGSLASFAVPALARNKEVDIKPTVPPLLLGIGNTL